MVYESIIIYCCTSSQQISLLFYRLHNIILQAHRKSFVIYLSEVEVILKCYLNKNEQFVVLAG